MALIVKRLRHYSRLLHPLQSSTGVCDPRPYLSANEVALGWGVTKQKALPPNVIHPNGHLLVDTGCVYCTMDSYTMARLVQIDTNPALLGNFNTVLRTLDTLPRDVLSAPEFPPFETKWFPGFSGCGVWAMFLSNVAIAFRGRDLGERFTVLTSLRMEAALGIPVIQQFIFYLNRQRSALIGV